LQAYSPYPGTRWANRWPETKKRDLGSQIKAIVKELKQAAVEIARLVEEAERQAELNRQKWEAEREQWRREEAERRAVEARKESRDELLQIIDVWTRANRIEQFFRDAEQRAAGLSDAERLRLLERLKLARKMVGSADALDRFMTWRAPDER
jgi:GTP1/Obg family GTP-binding protein